ncbi:hypothetical protein Tco_1412604 [Tanacetum coccineum]
MNSPPNHEWEEGLDIDDSDLLLTPIVCPTNNPHIVLEITTTTQTLISSQNHQVDTYDEFLEITTTTQTQISSQNHQVDTYDECEQALDIDNSDLQITPVVRPSNKTHIVPKITTTTQTLFSSQNNQVDNSVVKPIRILLGPAGIVQTAKLRKLANTQEGGGGIRNVYTRVY